MQQAGLRQIRGIGAAMCERLSRDHGIETIADLARLNDTEVDELQRALQAGRSNVRNGEVARWRDHARQLMGEGEAVADEPLATFVVEAWKPAGEPGSQPHFVVHHVEADETLETSAPQSAIDDVVRWMQERVTMAAAPAGTKAPVERQEVARSSAPEQLPPSPRRPPRRGRLRITGLEVCQEDHVINGAATPLLADTPVVIQARGALVFVGHVSLEGAEDPVTCRMRCRLHRIDSEQEITFTWPGETMVGPGMRTATMSSTPVSIPAGVYRGEFFAEDPHQGARRAFRELPLLVVN